MNTQTIPILCPKCGHSGNLLVARTVHWVPDGALDVPKAQSATNQGPAPNLGIVAHTDADRLDWLQAHADGIGQPPEWLLCRGCHAGASIREAIDAEMGCEQRADNAERQ